MRTDVKDVMKLFAVVGAVVPGGITLSAQMERRKFDLVTRVRQANRLKP